MKLGQKVMVKGRMVRNEDWRQIEGGFHLPRAVHKDWRAIPIAPREAIVVGRRTIQNGFSKNLGDDGVAWKATKFIKVFLVAHDINKAPFYALPEDIEPADPT